MNLNFYDKIIIPSLKRFFGSNFFISADRPIIFLCGGSDEKKSARYIFLEYLRKNNPELDITIAEVFFKVTKTGNDLLTLENQLADYADCIVLFVESPGSVAELGAFANHNILVSKLLVINNKKFKDSPSFINDGCIKLIESKSKFTPVIFCDMATPLFVAHEIIGTITKYSNRRRKSLDLGHEGFSKKVQLYFLIMLITLLNPITPTELNYIATKLDFFKEKKEVRKMINIVTTMGYANPSEKGYLYPTKYYMEPFLQHINIAQMKRIRAEILQFYRKNDKSRIDILNKEATLGLKVYE